MKTHFQMVASEKNKPVWPVSESAKGIEPEQSEG